jgi:hypothetical protein
LWPCFVPQPFLGSSLQSFSLTRIAHPSRGRFAPLQLSTDVRKRTGLRRSPLVSPTSTLSRSCLDPPPTMDSLSTNQGPFPGRPELGPAESLRSADFTYFEAFLPSRDRSDRPWVAPPSPAVSLGFLPLRSLILHASDPRPARTSRVRTRALVRRLGQATRRTAAPRAG